MKNKSRDFKFLQDKLEARLNGWRSKCLSWAGRCTLIKSVAQALPTYTMSSFEVTKKVCDALDSQSRRFWWNPKKQNGSYLAWKFWDHLCQPKGKGGLGFRYAKDFNMALLTKLSWMIATKRDSLCMRVLGSKYKVRNDWLRREPTKKVHRPIWKAIEKAKNIIVKGACYLVGNGHSINVWKDPWIPWNDDFKPKPRDEVVSSFQSWLKALSIMKPMNEKWTCWWICYCGYCGSHQENKNPIGPYSR